MLQLQRAKERKLDTRHKIQLGGLVVKAGLREHDKAFILGALIDAANKLEDECERQRLIAIGQKAFQPESLPE